MRLQEDDRAFGRFERELGAAGRRRGGRELTAVAASSPVIIIGAGLAGSEAAFQLARRGVAVRLYEMRPRVATAVHRTDGFAELVCSNSLRSASLRTAHGILKDEMRRLGSLVIEAAEHSRVPAGQALAVDRDRFSAYVTEAVTGSPGVTILREELTEIPEDGIVIVASGPLTSESLARDLHEMTGSDYLYFYDAVSPVVEVETIDFSKAFKASRYGKGGDDYINCPMEKDDYLRFHEELTRASSVDLHEIDKSLYFEGCLPIEVMARRGVDTLRYGPMKPVGLTDPRTGRRPYACVQLRQDNVAATLYNIVGFQNRLKWSEQKRILRLIPGLEGAEFSRYGMIHRNTYINAPTLLLPTFQSRARDTLFFAGQLSGVEGYTESAASGLLAGLNAARILAGEAPVVPPRTTALGSLCHYITEADPESYQPTNVAFGLMPPLETRVKPRAARKEALAARATAEMERFVSEHGLGLGPAAGDVRREA